MRVLDPEMPVLVEDLRAVLYIRQKSVMRCFAISVSFPAYAVGKQSLGWSKMSLNWSTRQINMPLAAGCLYRLMTWFIDPSCHKSWACTQRAHMYCCMQRQMKCCVGLLLLSNGTCTHWEMDAQGGRSGEGM